MEQLIAAWTQVNKKDKCEFKLRVAKRKNAGEAVTSPGPSAAAAT